MPATLCGFEMPLLMEREEMVATGGLLSVGGGCLQLLPPHPEDSSLAGRTPRLLLTCRRCRPGI